MKDDRIDLEALSPGVLLTVDQAARALGVAKASLNVWRSTGKHGIPFVRVGKLIRYRAGDLRAHCQKGVETPPPVE